MVSKPVSSAQQLPQPATKLPPSKESLRIAEEFEAIFAGQMVKAMRSSVVRSELFPESIGESIFTGMLDDEYSKMLTRNTSFGLAEQIARYIDSHGRNDPAVAQLDELQRGNVPIAMLATGRNEESAADGKLSSRDPSVLRWRSLIADAAQRYSIDESLICAVIAQESNGNQYAVSRAGAKGLMQIIDSTAKMLGLSQPFDAQENILAGTRYLKQLLEQFDGDEIKALASYNAGPAAVIKYNGIPPYRETQDYVRKVAMYKDYYAKYLDEISSR